MAKTARRIPPGAQAALDRYRLWCEAELGELDSQFFEATATVIDPGELLSVTAAFCVQRFDLLVRQMRPLEQSPGSRRLSPQYVSLVAEAMNRAAVFAGVASTPLRADLRERFLATVGLKLEARRLSLMAAAKGRLADRVTPDPADGGEAQVVSRAVIDMRRKLITAFRRRHDLSAAGFAREVGMSETTVLGVVKEDRSRYAPDRQDRILQAIGVSREDWYRP